MDDYSDYYYYDYYDYYYNQSRFIMYKIIKTLSLIKDQPDALLANSIQYFQCCKKIPKINTHTKVKISCWNITLVKVKVTNMNNAS